MNKDFLVIVIGRCISVIIAILSLKICTKILSVEEFGILGILFIHILVFSTIFISPVGQYVNRNLNIWANNKILPVYLRSFIEFSLLISILAGIISYITLNFIININNILFSCFLVALGTFSISAHGIMHSSLNILGNRFKSVLVNNTGLLIGLITSIILTTFETNANYWFLGQTFGFLMGAFVGLFFFNFKKTQFFNFKNLKLKNFYNFISPLILISIFVSFNTQGFKIILENVWNLYFLGIFLAAFNLTEKIFNIVESILQQLLTPYFFRSIKNDGDNKNAFFVFSDLMICMLSIYIITGVVIYGIGDIIFDFLIDTKFHEGKKFILYGVIFEFVRASANVINLNFYVDGKTKHSLLPNFIFSLLLLSFLSYCYFIELSFFKGVVGIIISSLIFLVLYFFYLILIRSFKFKLKDYIINILLAVLLYMFFRIDFNLNTIMNYGVDLFFVLITSILLFLNLYTSNGPLKRLFLIRLNKN